MPTTRRTFLAQALGAAGLLSLSPLSALARPSFVVANISQLYPVEVARIAVPRSTEEVAREVRAWGGKVAVGGGRYTNTGPVGSTVRALRMVLADGAVVDASPGENTALFRAAVGGYGAVGAIVEVELDLTENCRIERQVVPLTLDSYRAWFTRQVRDAPDVAMHNADLLPPRFDAPVAVWWRRTGKALTETARLVPRGQHYRVSQAALEVATEAPYGDLLVKHVLHPLMRSAGVVKWRNHEASLDVNELEPASRAASTYALQEYFIPVAEFEAFAREMAAVIRSHGAQVLNVSVRHAKADPVPLLPWAKEEVFSFVVYYKQQTGAAACAAVGEWTRAMIEAALRHGGRYYLPYQLHATKAQFERAYPEVEAFGRVKRALDPEGKFSNAMWARYL